MVKTSLELAKLIAEAASDKKARDIVLMNMIDLTPTTDYFVVCSAGSTTQVRAIADNIEEKLQEEAPISDSRTTVSTATVLGPYFTTGFSSLGERLSL